jgi:glutamate racemase
MTASPLNFPAERLDKSLPIGMFDSGVGGFTVLRQLKKVLPNESVVYFGDTANVPYGDRSPELIRIWAKNIIGFLIEQGVKAIAIACNVSSSVLTTDDLAEVPVPVFGLIYNGAAAALHATRNNRIGIIATAATVQTASYAKTIHGFSGDTFVIQSACPRFVPFVESGVFDGTEVEAAVTEYVKSLKDAGVDTVIYGCTHYPLLSAPVSRQLDGVQLIDPAIEIINEVAAYLHTHNLLHGEPPDADVIYASELSERFLHTAELLLGADIHPVARQVTVNRQD